MTKMYQNKEVTVVRSAREGDQGYDHAKGPQSLIRLADGTQKAVPDKEVTESTSSSEQT